MTDLVLSKPLHELQYIIFSPEQDNPCPGPRQASRKDFGYEIDEQELAEELLAALPTSFSISNPPDVDPHDFERVYGWFLS